MTESPSPVSESLLQRQLRLWQHLSGTRKLQFYFLTFLMLVSAIAEVVSLGAVIPFIGILTAPEQLLANAYFAQTVVRFGWSTADDLILPLTVVFISLAVFAGFVRVLLNWANASIAFNTGADISSEVYERTLYQPYSVHVSRNSSEVISSITLKVNAVVFGILFPILSLLSSVVLLIAILVALIVIDPLIAIIAAAGFLVLYAMVSLVARRYLAKNSDRIATEQTRVVKILQEGLGGIRDVLLDNAQEMYLKAYRGADFPLRRAQGVNVFVSSSPRFVVEAFGMSMIALLAYWLSFQEGGIQAALPSLAALALGAQRLLPALQAIYVAWANIVGSQASLIDVLELLAQPLPDKITGDEKEVSFAEKIQLEDVRFSYHSQGAMVLNGLSLEVKKGSRIGIVGTTGSGKSTLIDVLMGLLRPDSGRLLVDGISVDEKNMLNWQKQIAHVPQHIHLADASVAENIAYGIPEDEIDMERVKHASRLAQIAGVIESRPEGYSAMVGERGVKLSGGQRQRLGIARALYKQVSLLILDEATSALDTNTEKAVMSSIESLDDDLTIVLIAHRLSTIKDCDLIIEMNHGEITGMGSYQQLLQTSEHFHSLATTSAMNLPTDKVLN